MTTTIVSTARPSMGEGGDCSQKHVVVYIALLCQLEHPAWGLMQPPALAWESHFWCQAGLWRIYLIVHQHLQERLSGSVLPSQRDSLNADDFCEATREAEYAFTRHAATRAAGSGS